ncbi:DNA mismatch repair protein MutL [Sporormia fimetaria CBS 119925]|uniref:DNA mismatch repair protein PMS1 n=1 Tax=Sporormia fimetaria CBS 119925 TaxID=1340428 RepID=A0A6A6VI06_9PLEO|nr:DNA mismatch repair protein MutL [Sporormia fimetaria CBS 119925]
MATIKPIEGRSVHQIQSGQVIVDLNSVVKELVENALDAGATAIEVRFKNHGLDSIEVQDNGSGIAPEDFDTIGLKHYTSKLSTYDDLDSLTTFGFRGEALSSLCALSKFHIITARASDGAKGTKLDFETSGKLKGTSVVAAKQGTTVVVDSLFYNLPVRRKELEKTVKREYIKVLGLLHAYACISVGVKFSVSNQVPKGKKTVAFSTNANASTKENIANVYGAKTLLALVPLDLKFEMDPCNRPGATQTARNWSTQEDSGARTIKVVGYISRPVVGEGRQTPDRQMFFVNTRPCLLPQVSKAFNEVYKLYNITQSPFIFADIKLDTNAYDVNVSPDKRSIMLHDQTALLESLKNALVELFEMHEQSVPRSQLFERRVSTFKPPSVRPQVSVNSVPEDTQADIDKPIKADDENEARSDSSGGPSSPMAPGGRKSFPGFVKASLIEQFAERDTEERRVNSITRPKPTVLSEKRPCALPNEGMTTANYSIRDPSPLFEPDDKPATRSPLPPKPVQDFHARFLSQEAKRPESRASASDHDEPSIPSVTQSPLKSLSQSTIQNAFDRMRPMRSPLQEATITIGDTTTVSQIGSSARPVKRTRTPQSSFSGSRRSQPQSKPLLIKSLRGFVALGTQIASGGEDEGEETAEREGFRGEAQEDSDEMDSQDAEGEDTRMSDAQPSRSPSPEKRAPPEARVMAMEGIEQTIEKHLTDNEALSEGEGSIDAGPEPEDGSDDEYLDDSEKKAREEAKVAQMIAEAEEAAARPTEANIKRAKKLLRPTRKQYQTVGVNRDVDTSIDAIRAQIQNLQANLATDDISSHPDSLLPSTQLNPEERLTLTVSKSDFSAMRIIGQFNLGFILAVRPPTPSIPTPDLFIIDQHASDEKYNFEKFAASTVLVSQRLVHPHPLELTAIEEETILNHEHAVTANGFGVTVDTSGETPVGQRAQLVSLPMAKGATFTPTDFEELLTLLEDCTVSSSPSESASSMRYIPRPSKVRKLLASRACRSSIMIGKTLSLGKMQAVVRNMGEMDKPWSCPHGRPTMRHLFALDGWNGWEEWTYVEDDEVDGEEDEGVQRGGKTDWKAYLEER